MKYRAANCPLVYVTGRHLTFNKLSTVILNKAYVKVFKTATHFVFIPTEEKSGSFALSQRDGQVRITNVLLAQHSGLAHGMYYKLRRYKDGYCIRVGEPLTESEAKNGD